MEPAFTEDIPLTKEYILEEMKDPGKMTPRETMRFYNYLSSEYATMHMIASSLKAVLAGEVAKRVEEGNSVAKARTLTDGSKDGQDYILATGELTGLEECIRALKKTQQYHAEEIRNNW